MAGPGPHSVEARPSPWGGLTAILDTPLKRGVSIAVILAIMIVAPQLFGPYATVILTNALLYAILALGLNVVIGYAGLLDLGYAAFFAVGAYSVGILTTTYGWNFWATIPVAVMAAMIAGLVIGGPTLRLRSDYLAIVTLGFGEIVRITARNLEITGKASGISGIQQPWLFGWHIATPFDFYYVFLALTVIAVLVSVRLANSRLGRAWLYVRHDEDAAEAMGIDRVRVKLAAYVIGAIYGSIGGAFFAVNLTAISPQSFSFQQSTLFLMAVILGGMGKIPGVILGAFIVVLAPELLRDLGSFRYLIFAVGLLAIMLFPAERHLAGSEPQMSAPLLQLSDVTLSFAGNAVLQGVNFAVAEGSIVSLIGPNGAGKTSLFNCITGFYKPRAGRIDFAGAPMLKLKPFEVTRAGIARTFQNVRLFRQMSVLENVMSGQHCRSRVGAIGAILRSPSQRREERHIRDYAAACLAFVGIAEEEWERDATTLAYGHQRRVEIARALATEPKLLLLDEPAAGLTKGEKTELVTLISRIRDERGIAVLLIEHDTGLVMRISERVSVLDHGIMIAEGNPKEIQANPRVIEAYLGAEDAEDALAR